MLAYNPNSLDARKILENAKHWRDTAQIDDQKLAEIRARYHDELYSPNWAVRIGLFFFGLILTFAALGFMFLLLRFGELGGKILLPLAGLGAIAALETTIIGEKRHFRSGLDDIFLYFAIGCLFSGLAWIFEDWLPVEVRFAFAAAVLGFAALRYADCVVAVGSFLSGLGFVFSLVSRLAGQHAALVLPFAGMLCAAAVWWWVKKIRQRPTARFYEMPLDFVDAAALLVFYACGNFWCLKTGAVEFFGMENVPMPALFWAFTLLVPIAMIVFGLRKHFRIMLDIGLFLVAMSLATVRYFHSVMPLSLAATLGGAVLLAVAWLSIRYLRKHPESQFSADSDGKKSDLQRLQSLAIDRAAQRQSEAGGFRGADF